MQSVPGQEAADATLDGAPLDSIAAPTHDTTQVNLNINNTISPNQPHTYRSSMMRMPRTSHKEKKNTRANLTIASLNMKGGGSDKTRDKWQHINQVMRERRIGFLAVQETHLTSLGTMNLNSQFSTSMHIISSIDPTQPNAMGVALVLSKSRTAWKEAKVQILEAGRAILVTLPWHQTSKITILVIYAPNKPKENREFWIRIKDKITSGNLRHPNIMLGDFNIVEEAIDRLPAAEGATSTVNALKDLKEYLSLRDGWRHAHPNKIEYSYSQNKFLSASRLDRIYVTTKIWEQSTLWKIERTAIKTDHHLVSMSFSNPNAPFIGKGRWVLPMLAINNNSIMSKIKSLGTSLLSRVKDITEEKRSHTRNIQLIFRDFKQEITKLARDELRKKTVPQLVKNINQTRTLIDKTVADPLMNREDKRLNLEVLNERLYKQESIRHARIRDNLAAKMKIESHRIGKTWIQSNREKKPRDVIPHLRRKGKPPGSQDEFATRSEEMAEIARDHHASLQAEGLTDNLSNNDYNEVLDHLDVSLNNSQKADLTKALTEDEIRLTLHHLPDGKSPGLDGIPYELWKKLDKHFVIERKEKKQDRFDIVKTLCLLYNDIEKYGIIKGSNFAEGWMAPIPKKGDMAEISNYRPITVLNTDYKLMTRTLTTKLAKAIPDVIHHDQAGFMKGRHIEDQTELTKAVLNYAETTETNGMLVCLDQEKAYDKISHDFLWKSLSKFNIPRNFSNTVKALYSDAHTCVMINGVRSPSFQVTRGVRQGDPLSCLLFNLAIESLATLLRKSSLMGVKTPDGLQRLITSLFADDTTVYLSASDNFEDLLTILTKWCRVSGAKFNTQKTVILPMGSTTFRNDLILTRKSNNNFPPLPDDIKIAKDGEPVRVLGAFVGNNIQQCSIWTPTVEKIQSVLEYWTRSHPTQDGKRLIVGMEVGGRTQYLTKVQGMPKDIEKQLQKIIRKFMWDDSQSMVNEDTLYLDISLGGKKLLDIEARNEAILLKTLQRYLLPNPS